MQALALVLLGRASEAEQLATNCLAAAKQMSGSAAERSSFVASCYNCLGEVLKEMGRLGEAEEAAREGLAMREKVGFGVDFVESVQTDVHCYLCRIGVLPSQFEKCHLQILGYTLAVIMLGAIAVVCRIWAAIIQ